MVDFVGHILPFDPLAASSALITPGFPPEHARVESIDTVYEVAPNAGPDDFACNEPISILHTSLPGYFCKSFFHDYYERVWVIPDLVNFGAITRDESATVFLWNSWLVHVTIQTITLEDTDNLSIDGPTSGYVYHGLEMVEYSVDVLAAGNPLLDGRALFAFAHGEVPVLLIKGVRAFFWELIYWPNWRDTVRISYEYRTEIITSRSGLEQRRAVRNEPRKKLEFTASIFNTPYAKAFRDYRRFLDMAQNKMIVVPEFPRLVKVAGSVPQGAVYIPVESTPDWLVAGRMVALHDEKGASLYLVRSVSSAGVRLTQTLSRDWSSNTSIVAGVGCRLPDSAASKDLTTGILEADVRLDAFPDAEPEESFSQGSAGMVFDGREVFTRRNNWARPVDIDSVWPLEDVDMGFGIIETFEIIQFPSRLIKAEFLLTSRDDAESLVRFFFRMRGRRGEFFMPTWENEFTLRLPALSGSNRIRVVGTEVLLAYTESTTHTAILVRQNDGSFHPFKIATMFQESDSLGDDTVIEFDEMFLINITAEETASIDWLLLSRFASDILTLSWQTDGVATVELSIQTLVYSEAE